MDGRRCFIEFPYTNRLIVSKVAFIKCCRKRACVHMLFVYIELYFSQFRNDLCLISHGCVGVNLRLATTALRFDTRSFSLPRQYINKVMN